MQVTQGELGLTRDRYTKARLREKIHDKTNSVGWIGPNDHTISRGLQEIIDDFAEKGAAGAIANLQNYLDRLAVSGYTSGGRRATNTALLYTRDRLLPSQNDIGAIGEGIAGYYLEDIERLIFEVRPFDVSPDLIFRTPSTGGVVLAEVKSTLKSKPTVSRMVGVAIPLLEILAKTKFIRRGNYAAYVVAVRIIDSSLFELSRLSVEEL